MAVLSFVLRKEMYEGSTTEHVAEVEADSWSVTVTHDKIVTKN